MGNKTNDVLTISRYIVNECNSKKIIISNLKLQKLLYLVQGFYMAFYHKRCFDDDIQAWDYGPVCPNAYHEFKRFGANNIPPIHQYEELIYKDKKLKWVRHDFKSTDIDDTTREIIDAVVESYGRYSATALVNITHKQKPWDETYHLHPSEKNVVIDDELIESYFEGLVENG